MAVSVLTLLSHTPVTILFGILCPLSLFVYILAHLESKVNIFTYNCRATYANKKRE